MCRSTIDGRCAWALLGTGLLLCGAVYATTATGDRINIQLDNITIGKQIFQRRFCFVIGNSISKLWSYERTINQIEIDITALS